MELRAPADDELEALRQALLVAAPALWREFPWRTTRDPWRVLVSEVMLQQTQAPRVVEPYSRFVARFPTPSACASAGSAEVVRAWAGLGYNRRAVHLHKAAVEIVARHGGEVPDDLASLRTLAGVGEYTARAVLAFAFERAVGAVDVNTQRVLARAVAGGALTRTEAQSLADRLVAGWDSWLFNQAMFDLGARVCVARRPACDACPIASHCRWSASNAAAAGAHRAPMPDPAARRRAQSRFEGSDRQGRGRLVAALVQGPVGRDVLARVAGWPQDDERAVRVASRLCADGVARWDGGELVLA